jgi:hypothetical protein
MDTMRGRLWRDGRLVLGPVSVVVRGGEPPPGQDWHGGFPLPSSVTLAAGEVEVTSLIINPPQAPPGRSALFRWCAPSRAGAPV